MSYLLYPDSLAQRKVADILFTGFLQEIDAKTARVHSTEVEPVVDQEAASFSIPDGAVTTHDDNTDNVVIVDFKVADDLGLPLNAAPSDDVGSADTLV